MSAFEKSTPYATIQLLKRQNVKLRQALEFYADVNNYETCSSPWRHVFCAYMIKESLNDTEVINDNKNECAGKRARQALKECYDTDRA